MHEPVRLLVGSWNISKFKYGLSNHTIYSLCRCTYYQSPSLSCTRLYVEQLQSPDEAVRIVKESQSVEGAKMVAR